MCSFYLQGRCVRGSSCNFAHKQEEIKARPDFYRTSLCKSFQRDGRCDDPECKYAHDRKELRPRCMPRASRVTQDMRRTVLSPRQSSSNIIVTQCILSATDLDGSDVNRSGNERIEDIITASSPQEQQAEDFSELRILAANLWTAATQRRPRLHSPMKQKVHEKCSERGSFGETVGSESTAALESDNESTGKSISWLSNDTFERDSFDHMCRKDSFDYMYQHDSFDDTRQPDSFHDMSQPESLDHICQRDSSDWTCQCDSFDHMCQRFRDHICERCSFDGTCEQFRDHMSQCEIDGKSTVASDPKKADLRPSLLMQSLDLSTTASTSARPQNPKVCFMNGLSATVKCSFLQFDQFDEI